MFVDLTARRPVTFSREDSSGLYPSLKEAAALDQTSADDTRPFYLVEPIYFLHKGVGVFHNFCSSQYQTSTELIGAHRIALHTLISPHTQAL